MSNWHPSLALIEWIQLILPDLGALGCLVGGVAALLWPVLALPMIAIAVLGAVTWLVRTEADR